MSFWDSSAIVPLLKPELLSPRLLSIYRQDPSVIVWWGTPVECASALGRWIRDRPSGGFEIERAFDYLERLRTSWHEMPPSQALRDVAIRLLRVHDLRAADALQLAAALAAAEGRPSMLEVISLDARLAEAAQKEGFRVSPSLV